MTHQARLNGRRTQAPSAGGITDCLTVGQATAAARRFAGKSPYDAREDVVQEFLLGTLVAAEHGSGDIRSLQVVYGYGFARNFLRWRRRRGISFSPPETYESVESGNPADDPAAASALATIAENLRQGIAALPEHLALVVRLRYWDGLTTREMAGDLGITHQAAGKRLAAARRSLRKHLERRGMSAGEVAGVLA